jgi:hypothetical protein
MKKTRPNTGPGQRKTVEFSFFLSFFLFYPLPCTPTLEKEKRKEETSKSESQQLCQRKSEELFQEEEEELQSPSHPIRTWSGLALNCISVSQ